MPERRRIGRLAGLILVTNAVPAWGVPADRLAEAIQGLSLALIAPGILASFVALEIVLWLLAPGPLTATSRAIARGRGRCLLVGVGTGLAAFLLVAALGEKGQFLAPVVIGLAGLGMLAGLSAVAALLGQAAVEAATGREGSQALAVAVGAALLFVASIFPIVGWVLFVYFLLVGLGGFVLAVLGRGKE